MSKGKNLEISKSILTNISNNAKFCKRWYMRVLQIGIGHILGYVCKHSAMADGSRAARGHWGWPRWGCMGASHKGRPWIRPMMSVVWVMYTRMYNRTPSCSCRDRWRAPPRRGDLGASDATRGCPSNMNCRWSPRLQIGRHNHYLADRSHRGCWGRGCGGQRGLSSII